MSEQGNRGAKSPHAFMREALGVQSRLLEQRRVLVAAALEAEQSALETGSGHLGPEVDAYFEARAAGRPALRPPLRTWRR